MRVRRTPSVDLRTRTERSLRASLEAARLRVSLRSAARDVPRDDFGRLGRDTDAGAGAEGGTATPEATAGGANGPLVLARGDVGALLLVVHDASGSSSSMPRMRRCCCTNMKTERAFADGDSRASAVCSRRFACERVMP